MADTIVLPAFEAFPLLSSAVRPTNSKSDSVDAANDQDDVDLDMTGDDYEPIHVDVNGGYIQPAVMPAQVTRLQCGAAVAVAVAVPDVDVVPVPAPPKDETCLQDEAVSKYACVIGLPFATRLLNRQPVNVW